MALVSDYIGEQLAAVVAGSTLAGACQVARWDEQLPAGWALRWSLPTVDIMGVDLARAGPTYTFETIISAPEGLEKEYEEHYLTHMPGTLLYELSRLPWIWSVFVPSLTDYPGGKRLEASASATLEGYRFTPGP